MDETTVFILILIKRETSFYNVLCLYQCSMDLNAFLLMITVWRKNINIYRLEATAATSLPPLLIVPVPVSSLFDFGSHRRKRRTNQVDL